MKFFSKTVCIAVLALLGSANAFAMPVVGEVGFGGNWARGAGDEVTFDGSAVALTSSGDFAVTIPQFSLATFNDFVFNPFVGPHVLWTAGGFTFSLNTANIVLNVGNEITLNGTGTISSAGFDDTATNWDFSTNNLTFSTANVPAPVAEPGTLALLGFGLLGLGLRRRMNAK